MGFQQDRQRMEFTPFRRLMLAAHGRDMVMLMVKKLNALHGRDQWAQSARRDTRFDGRIVVTDGLQWSIYYPDSEIPDLHFGLDEPGAFWDLLVIGQTHNQPPDHRSR